MTGWQEWLGAAAVAVTGAVRQSGRAAAVTAPTISHDSLRLLPFLSILDGLIADRGGFQEPDVVLYEVATWVQPVGAAGTPPRFGPVVLRRHR